MKNKLKEGETREVVKNLIENKLFVAEQNREKELQKRLENLRKHVGLGGWMLCLNSFLSLITRFKLVCN